MGSGFPTDPTDKNTIQITTELPTGKQVFHCGLLKLQYLLSQILNPATASEVRSTVVVFCVYVPPTRIQFDYFSDAKQEINPLGSYGSKEPYPTCGLDGGKN